MKFVTPEIEVKKFDLEDILTVSTVSPDTEATESPEESAAVWGIEDCGPTTDT